MTDDLDEIGLVVGNGGAVVMGNGGVGLNLVVVDHTELFSTTIPHRHSPESHPRLMPAPGSTELALAADLMWPSQRQVQDVLLWL